MSKLIKTVAGLAVVFPLFAQAATYTCELNGHIARITLDTAAHTIRLDNEWGTKIGIIVQQARNYGQFDTYSLGSIWGPSLEINRTRTDEVYFHYCGGCLPYVCQAAGD